MITKVSLKNWRSHADSELAFTSGTNALLGILGSGKSSVLDAVCFCLFGTFPNLQSRKLKIEDVLMRKPEEKGRAEVEVYFAEDGKTYSVKRVIERGKGTTYSEVRENGRIIESPNTSRVNELVEKILKVNYDLFSKAIYSEQNSLDYFLTIPRGQRMKKIDELLGIDRFEKARANAVSLANKLLERKSARQSAIDAAGLEEAEKAMAEMRKSMEEIKRERAAVEAKIGEIKTQRINVEAEIADARKIKSELEERRREEKGIASVLQDTYTSLRALEKSVEEKDADAVERGLREVARHLSDMESALRDEQKNYSRLTEQAAKARTEMEIVKRDKVDVLEKELDEKLKAKSALKGKEAKPEKVEAEMERKKKLVERFEAEMAVLKMRADDMKETIQQINAIEARCPVCDSKITKEKKRLLVKKRLFEIDKLKEKWAKSAKEKDLTRKELETLEKMADKLKEYIEAVKDLDEVQSELNAAKSMYVVSKQQVDSLVKELKEAEKNLLKIDRIVVDARKRKEALDVMSIRAKDYQERRYKIETLLVASKQVNSVVKQLEDSLARKSNERLEKMWEELVTEEKTLGGKSGSLSHILLEREARVKSEEAKLAGARKIAEEIRKLDKFAEDLKIFEKALEATQVQLRREFVTSVNYTMNELWPSLYPYQDFTRMQLAIEEGDYVLQLQDRSGKWTNVEGFASGGERSIAALTLRIAFALVLAPQLKWLVLDEPTANMDARAVEDLATTLGERIGDFIDQTFLITHDEKLESAVTGYAYRFQRDKSKDEPTKIIPI